MGGSEAIPHEFPWIVLILIRSTQGPDWAQQRICSGTILNSKWILTAGHCAVHPLQSYQVLAGVHNKKKMMGMEQMAFLETIVVHPNYNP